MISFCCWQAAFNGGNALLAQDKFGQLDQLLDKTDMYTKFLKEQMEQMAEDMDGGANEAVGSKRKAGRQGGNTRKKGAAGALSAQMKVCSTLLKRLTQFAECDLLVLACQMYKSSWLGVC